MTSHGSHCLDIIKIHDKSLLMHNDKSFLKFTKTKIKNVKLTPNLVLFSIK